MQRILDRLCTLETITAAMPTADALEVLCEQQRRKEIVGHLLVILLGLTAEDRRVLLMYAGGHSYTEIGQKIRRNKQYVYRVVDGLHKKLSASGELRELLIPPQSTKEASTAQVKINLCFDSATKAYDGSYWGKYKGKRAWKTRVVCRVPEYLQSCFTDGETKCSLCGSQCTRRRDN